MIFIVIVHDFIDFACFKNDLRWTDKLPLITMNYDHEWKKKLHSSFMKIFNYDLWKSLRMNECWWKNFFSPNHDSKYDKDNSHIDESPRLLMNYPMYDDDLMF